MTENIKLKAKWKALMGPLAAGHATRKMVSAFDQLTSRVYSAKIIDFDEFIGAQHVILTARKAAETQDAAGLEGHFLAKDAA